MIATTYSSQPVFLIQLPPDWSRRVNASFDKSHHASRVVGMSAREDRESMGEKMKASLSYQTLMKASEATAARGVLTSWDNRPVLCPFWPALRLAAGYAAASVQGTLRVWFEPDWSAYSINTGTSPTHTPTANTLTAPLMWAKFDGMPLRTVVSGADDEIIQISVIENGAATYALTPKTTTLTNGSNVNGQTIPLLTVPAAWGANQGTVEVRIKEDRVGFVRQSADTFYAQAPRERNTLNFSAMNTDEVAYLISLFANRDGAMSPLWALPPHSTASGDRVFGRFYSDKLELTWITPSLGAEMAECSLDFLTLPTEQTLPSGETMGTTIGSHAKRFFCYLVTCGAQTWRYTSRESDITGPGGYTFESRPITHGEITEEINLQVNDCPLTVHAWAGCPFSALATQHLREPMQVTIYEGLVTASESAAAIYTGTAQAPERAGLGLRIKLKGPGAVLSMKGPRMMNQETCRANFGDSRCGVNIETHAINEVVFALDSGPALVSANEVLTTDPKFKGGYVRRNIGTTLVPIYQYIPILSTGERELGPSTYRVYNLARVPSPPLAEGEAVRIYIACNKLFATCDSTFDNRSNFRGHPRMPRTNPSIVPVQMNTTGKKG